MSEIYKTYRTNFKNHQMSSSFLEASRKITPILQRWVIDFTKDSPILDLGCGAGEVLMAFKDLGFTNLSGCDISQEQVLAARQFFEFVETKDIFQKLKENCDSSFGIITLFDVVEHIERERVLFLLKECRRILRPGGLLIGHCPNGLSPFFGADFWSDPTHIWCYTPKSIEVLARAAGFSEIKHMEHLGESFSVQGFVRLICWRILRSFINLCYKIETNAFHEILTKNFAFCLKKN